SRSKTTHITVGLFWTAGALRLPALQKTPFSPHATHKKTPGKPGVLITGGIVKLMQQAGQPV
ncbi:hypothetical protein, partial [Cronobacter malonaticus]|uniref:hypothetical protein n=1 Tax=Cronobacter malonaticus TaxID=413503 RepID=UPI001F19A2A5